MNSKGFTLNFAHTETAIDLEVKNNASAIKQMKGREKNIPKSRQSEKGKRGKWTRKKNKK